MFKILVRPLNMFYSCNRMTREISFIISRSIFNIPHCKNRLYSEVLCVHQFPKSCDLRIIQQYILINPTRFRSTGQDSYHSDSDASDSENDDEESDNEFDMKTQVFVLFNSQIFQEDESLPETSRDMKLNVKSLRVDTIMGNSLNIARNKVDDYFLSSKLLLNGEKLLKKSKKVSEGDYIDLITSTESGINKFKRVRILQITEQRTKKTDKTVVYVRAWKSNMTRPVKEKKRI